MIKYTRKKERSFLLTIIYRFSKLPLLGNKAKFKLYLNLEWIFDRLAHEKSFEFYTADTHPFRIQQQKAIMNRINETHKVMDLGCAYGLVSNFIAEKAKLVVGIDHDTKAIEKAKATYIRPNLLFFSGDAIEYLEKNTEQFDILILSHILEHLDDPEAFLLQFKKYFKLIYVEVPDYERYLANVYRQDLALKLTFSDNDHIWEWDRGSLMSLLEKCGLEIISSEYIFGIQRYWLKAA